MGHVFVVYQPNPLANWMLHCVNASAKHFFSYNHCMHIYIVRRWPQTAPFSCLFFLARVCMFYLAPFSLKKLSAFAMVLCYFCGIQIRSPSHKCINCAPEDKYGSNEIMKSANGIASLAQWTWTTAYTSIAIRYELQGDSTAFFFLSLFSSLFISLHEK